MAGFDVNIASPVNAQDFSRPHLATQDQFGLWVSTEGAVTTSAGLTVNVAAVTANEYIIGGTVVTTAYTASTVTVGAAHATLYRRDLVYIDNAGTVAVAAGTAAAITVVVAPTLAATRLALAEITIAPAQTTLASTDIIDKRLILARKGWEHIDTQVLTATAASVSFASLSTTFKQFRLTFFIEATAALTALLRVNNISTGTYDSHRLEAAAAGTTSADTAADTSWSLSTNVIVAGGWGRGTVEISQEVLGQNPAMTSLMAVELTATTIATQWTGGTQRNTTALISRIDLLASASTFAANSRFVLEGNRSTT